MIEPILLSYFFFHLIQLSSQVQLEKEVSNRGVLTVQLENSPIQSIQPGSQRVPMLTIRATASCDEDIELRSIRVRRRGLGASSDIESVYVMSEGQRINRGRQLTRSGFAGLSFRNLIVPTCDTKTLQVFADFSSSAAIAGEHWLTVEQASDVDVGNARSVLVRSGIAPPRGRATGTTRGTITVEYVKLLNTVRYGSNRTVGRFRLIADSEDDHLIRAITFTNDGAARNNDLQNLYLRAGRNRRVSLTEEQLSGDTVRFVLNPALLLKKNQKRLFQIQADVRASRKRTIKLLIEEPSDIEAEPTRSR